MEETETQNSISVKLVPSDVLPDEFEELLATDRFFRDCFNEYLAQPIFSQTLRFNPITFRFELASEERENVVSMIRNAVYQSRPKPKCQKVVGLHAFRPITLLPMEFDNPDPRDIASEFSVDILEGEEASDWIKFHRLPMFLNSDLYNYYRLGSLLTQAATIYRASGRTSVVYDSAPVPKKPPKLRNLTVAEKFELENTYVCYGASVTTNSEHQYAQSQVTKKDTTSTTFSSSYNTPRLSELMSRPKSARPAGSSAVTSRPSSSVFLPTTLSEAITDSGRDSEDEITAALENRGSSSSRDIGSALSIIPLPSDVICVAERSPLGPLELTKSEKEGVTTEEKPAEPSVEKERIAEHILPDGGNEGLTGLEKCKDPKTAQALITVLRRAFPQRKVSTESMLSRLMLNRFFEKIVNNMESPEHILNCDIKSVIERAEILEQEDGEIDSISGDIFPEDIMKEKDESDVKTIGNLQQLRSFEEFIKKSSGWPVFNLWLDIDRLKRKLELENLKLTPPIRQLIISMRKKYLKPGGELFLSSSVQKQLQLDDPDQWTAEYLPSIQPDIMRILLSYWAIRYFVHENSKTSNFLKNNGRYQVFKNELVGYQPVNHEPKTPAAIPMRPKSCMPRLKAVEDKPKPSRFSSRVTQAKLSPRNPEMPFRRSFLLPIEDLTGADEFADARNESDSVRRNRPKTAPAERAKTPEIENSEGEDFLGSDRMENLLSILHKERLAGQFLELFIRQANNKTWLNSLLFWLDLQEYHQMFIGNTESASAILSKANQLYSAYVMAGAADDIGIDLKVALKVAKVIDPPYEELFDEVEEHVILTLNKAIVSIAKNEREDLSALKRQTTTRKVETSNAEILQLNNLGWFRKSAVLPSEEDLSMGSVSQITLDDKRRALWENVPEQFQHWTLDMIIFNRVEKEAFRQFLEDNSADTDMSCWMDIENYRRLPPGSDQLMNVKAIDIREKYLNKKYFFSTISPATKKEQGEMIAKNGGWSKLMAVTPPPALLTETQIYVRRRLDSRWLPVFLATEEFAERQKPPPVNTEDSEMALKRKRAAQIAKMLEGHWSATAQESLIFRNALSEERTRRTFYRFLKLRTTPGEFLANDLRFYDEVQKYKQMYHSHADDSQMHQKVQQIITCFLEDMHKNPTLQIDIPIDMAEKIIWQRKELGAYLFRDAQLTVFRILLPHWEAFRRFRETVPIEPEEPTRKVRAGKKVYTLKTALTSGINPRKFMASLERRKIILDRQRAPKEEKKMAGDEEDEESERAPTVEPEKSVSEEDEEYNPFSLAKPAVRVWRYSDYENAIEREFLINNTNASTFKLNEDEFNVAKEYFPNLFLAEESIESQGE